MLAPGDVASVVECLQGGTPFNHRHNQHQSGRMCIVECFNVEFLNGYAECTSCGRLEPALAKLKPEPSNSDLRIEDGRRLYLAPPPPRRIRQKDAREKTDVGSCSWSFLFESVSTLLPHNSHEVSVFRPSLPILSHSHELHLDEDDDITRPRR